DEYLKLIEHCLKTMARGGMYDVVGGGFSRYSTDDHWRVPHFEKMLYDNALLARAYLHTWQVTRDPFYKRIAAETLNFVATEMTHEPGGFYSSLDADSEGQEGKFYVWSLAEIEALLGDHAASFAARYDVTPQGNFEGRTILNRLRDLPHNIAPPADDEVRLAPLPGPHAGLGVDAYLQATSPIRRYSDLLHQRQLAALLAGEAPVHPEAETREIAALLFDRERLVRGAEGDREDYWICVLLEERGAAPLDGLVSRPPLRGRGQAWIPELLRELPFAWPKDAPPPPEGTPMRFLPGSVRRHRGAAILTILNPTQVGGETGESSAP
ncbi:MAG: RNB domain-containing ribonuclease, partial [Planctomycetaceae bacterium]|nr:RNB domain-containing ribonuclease [Planctomycetaceae bacterium]